MIDRKRLEELRSLLGLKIDLENFPVVELLNTVSSLLNIKKELESENARLRKELEELRKCSICHEPFLGDKPHINCGDFQPDNGKLTAYESAVKETK